MKDTFIYIEGVFICAFFIGMLFILNFKLRKEKGFKCLAMVYVTTLLCAALDISWILVEGHPELILWNKIINVCFLTIFSYLGYFWLMHILYKIYPKEKINQNKIHLILLIYPFALTILNVLSFKYGLTVKVTSEGIYERGPFNILVQVCTYGYCTIASLLSIFKAKKIEDADIKKECYIQALFFIPTLILGIIQLLLDPGTPVTYFGLLISLLVYYSDYLQIRTKITEVKYQKELQVALDKAEEANKSKSVFLFNMSHDIRTPMNSVLGFANMAKKNIGDDKRVEECLDKLESSGNVLLTLINEILEMSKVENGDVQIDSVPVDITTNGKDVVSMLKTAAEEKNINFSFRLTNIKHKYVYVDVLHLTRCIVNLVSNAIKYTNAGGKVDFVISEVDSDDSQYARYKFSIMDTGIGISGEFISKIFDEFSRERTSTSSGTYGAGLGLSITKKLIELMGGKISVESTLGVGSTFTIDVPFKIVENYNELKNSVNNSYFDFQGKRILLVEDSELNRQIAHDILEEEGMIVEDAEDGKVAVEKIIKNKAYYYDAVLMDIQMPVMDGYEATKAIRTLDDVNLSKVPIIALSANTFLEDKQKSFECGMNDHIAKPININVLKECLAKYL